MQTSSYSEDYPWTIDKKIVIQGKVSEAFPDIEWIYDKKGELKKQNFDAADAYVAALGHLNKKRYGEIEFSSEIIGESNNGKGIIEIVYNINYWGKSEERRTYINVNE